MGSVLPVGFYTKSNRLIKEIFGDAAQAICSHTFVHTFIQAEKGNVDSCVAE